MQCYLLLWGFITLVFSILIHSIFFFTVLHIFWQLRNLINTPLNRAALTQLLCVASSLSLSHQKLVAAMYNLIGQSTPPPPSRLSACPQASCIDRPWEGPRGMKEPKQHQSMLSQHQCLWGWVFKAKSGGKKGIWTFLVVVWIAPGSYEHIRSVKIKKVFNYNNTGKTANSLCLLWRCNIKEKKCHRVRRVTVSIIQPANRWQLGVGLRPELLHVSVCLQGQAN